MTLDKDRHHQRIYTLEWLSGLNRGELQLESPMNRIECGAWSSEIVPLLATSVPVRSDMLDSFDEEDWMLVPTQETCEMLFAFLLHNARADVASRKVLTDEFSAAEHEYDFKPVRTCDPNKRPVLYAQTGDGVPRAFPYPYEGLRVRSRAHPLFVLYMADNFVVYRNHPGFYDESSAVFKQIARPLRLLHRSPPVEFVYGSDLPQEHRHPRSLAPSSVHRSNGGPSHGSASTLGKRKRGEGSQEPDLDARAAEDKPMDDLYAHKFEVYAWAASVEMDDSTLRCASTTGSAEDDAALAQEADAALAQYAQEAFRDPEEVMRTGRRLESVSTPRGQKRDTSRFCSNH